MNILETKELDFDFSGHQVLFNVNFKVKKGERHAIIGPNGAGKTTLFNVITGAYTPSKGKILFKEKDVTSLGPAAMSRHGMGRSFQITSTFTEQSAFKNIRMGILSRNGIRFNIRQKVDKMQAITEATDKLVQQVNLHVERDRLAKALSYGKHRALEVGMALSTNPDLVMLDEPTAGISKDETVNTVKLIRRLTEGKTMVIIEHDMEVIFSLADRITVLHLGQILATGAPDEIRKNQAVKDAYLGNLEV